uniref:UPAR/Ly6 domain-containing protein n=1 Tax=Cyclopterus lumpus TaxID=8103 RepID=A0A8C2ZCT5_CYCLU
MYLQMHFMHANNLFSLCNKTLIDVKLVSSLLPPEFSADMLDIHERGCIEESGCKNSYGHILTVNYTVTRTCCSNSLCNGAASIQLPLTAALGSALVAVWSHWGL